MNFKSFPFHFIMIASFQILSLYAANVKEANIMDAMLILLIVVFLTSFLFLLSWFITRDIQRSGIIASFYCFLFFIYGRIYRFKLILGLSQIGIIRHRYLMPVFGIVVIAGTLWVFRNQWSKKFLGRITNYLNVFSSILVAVSLLMSVINSDRTSYEDIEYVVTPHEVDVIFKPNVYFLIFDGFTSQKALREYYGWNDDGFVNALRERGFSVNEDAFSNYPFTHLSIAATLNICYIHEDDEFFKANYKYGFLMQSIKQNKVMEYFRANGYEVIMPEYAGGKQNYNISTAYERGVALLTSEFMRLTISTSMLCGFSHVGDLFIRGKILNRIRRLNQFDVPNKPTFLYEHIVCPHIPFIFRADGSKPTTRDLMVNEKHPGEDYVEQVRFMETKIIEILDNIKARDPSAVIIVQGDHGMEDWWVGPYSSYGWNRPPQNFVNTRFRILHAIFTPPGIIIPEHNSPVNLFRYLCNAIFDSKLEILPDKAFHTHFREPYNFYDVTSDLKNMVSITK